jgi:hypothetical protein
LKLELDKDAKMLDAPIDRVEFFEKAIAALSADRDKSDPAAVCFHDTLLGNGRGASCQRVGKVAG